MSLEGQGGSAPSVSLRSVTKRFGDFTAVRGMDLDVVILDQEGELFDQVIESGGAFAASMSGVATPT